MRTLAKPIQMVNWIDEKGGIHPLRFRIKGEDDTLIVVRITQTHTCQKEMISGNITYTFRCSVLINDQDKLCEIRFYPEKPQWILFKI